MTGPDLDHELGSIGRRVSPRLGAAQEAVFRRATAAQGVGPRRPRLAPPGRGRLGGAALTVAFGGAFAALLAVGVASPRVSPNPSVNGPAVALATSPGAPSGVVTPVGGPGSPPPASAVLPAPAAPTASSTAPAVTVSPTGAVGSDGGDGPTPPTPASTPPTAGSQPGSTQAATAEPSAASTPTPAPQAEHSPAAQTTPTAPPRFAATTTPAAPQRIVLTDQDNGRTITIRPGDSVEVDLPGSQGWRWTAPQSSDATVLRSSSTTTKSNGSARGVFVTAGKNGSAEIRATRDPACASSKPPCMAPSQLFQVTVVVTG